MILCSVLTETCLFLCNEGHPKCPCWLLRSYLDDLHQALPKGSRDKECGEEKGRFELISKWGDMRERGRKTLTLVAQLNKWRQRGLIGQQGGRIQTLKIVLPIVVGKNQNNWDKDLKDE